MNTDIENITLDELTIRLNTFTQQLNSINELLKTDSTNEECLNIKRDLQEVITLTQEMITLKNTQLSRNDSNNVNDIFTYAAEQIQTEPNVNSINNNNNKLNQNNIDILYNNNTNDQFIKNQDNTNINVNVINNEKKSTKKQNIQQIKEFKPIKIPENLKILPTDTEIEKERKKKRMKAIKSLNRHKQIENERNVKQQEWKNFQAKNMKRKSHHKTILTNKNSIFASPATVDGKVGVSNSGKGMTIYQDSRKKTKRN